MNSMKKRIFSLFMAVVLCFSMMPTSALAKDADISAAQENLKGAEDTAEANVTEGDTTKDGVADGNVTGVDVTGSDVTGGDTTGGSVTDSDATGSDVTDGDATGGDTGLQNAAVQAVQKLIDALPAEVTPENADEIATQLMAIDEALSTLTDEQIAQLDMTRYEALCAALAKMTQVQSGTHVHFLCGSTSYCYGNGHSQESTKVDFEEWTETTTLPESGTYYLTANVDLSSTWIVPGDLTLCLNGNTITMNGEGAVIEVAAGATFTLCNCKTAGTITHGTNDEGTRYSGRGVTVSGDSTFNMYGGTISYNELPIESGTLGGGVYVEGTFNMYGGTISNNTAYSGGGVYIPKGDAASTFNMYGGTITNNEAQFSGGVDVNAHAYMYGGTITTNKGFFGGGVGVGNYGSLSVSGSIKITGNTDDNDKNDNLYVTSSTGVTVGGELTGSIGVYVSSLPKVGGSVTVAKGSWGATAYSIKASDKDVFTADAGSEYVMRLDSASNVIKMTNLHSNHPICGISCNHAGDETHSGVTWVSITDLSEIAGDGNYYLANNVTLTETWECNYDVNLCLNGHNITMTTAKTTDIEVPEGKTFTLCDCAEGKITGYTDAGVLVNGTFNMYSGVISKCTGSSYMYAHAGVETGYYAGVINLYGGTLKDNDYGVTVWTTFNMYGGVITGSKYSGVNNCGGQFTMSGGSITKNNVSSGNFGGAGVYIMQGSSSFTMTGGEITNNSRTKSSWGGGAIYMQEGTITMEGGTISGNSADQYGGGITLLHGTFLMKGGTISNNTTSTGLGGGVSVGVGTDASNPGTFRMEGGTITGNSAGGNGGGVYVGSTGTCKVSGTANITGNKSGDDTNNVYLLKGATIKVAEEGLTDGASIGVTTEKTPSTGSFVTVAEGDSALQDSDLKVFSSDAGLSKQLQGGKVLFVNGTLHEHGVCGSKGCKNVYHNNSHKDVLWQPLTYDSNNAQLLCDGVAVSMTSSDATSTGETLYRYTLPAGNYYLAEDITISGQIIFSDGGNLCLNKKSITNKMYDCATIYVSGGEFNLCDCGNSAGNGMITSNSSSFNGVQVFAAENKSATFNMYGGEITGHRRGVYALGSGTVAVRIYDGIISYNEIGVIGGDELTIGGPTQIIDNTINVSLSKDQLINIDWSMQQYAEIGITTEEVPDETNKNIQFATGATNDALDYTKIFIPDVKDQNYRVTKIDSDLYLSAHEHSWVYTAQGATITARCEGEDCNLDEDFAVTYTIEVPENLVYSGAAKEASVKLSELPSGLTMPDSPAITYSKKVGEDYLVTEEKPVDAGTYKASITIEGETASLVYSILPKEITDPVITVADAGSYDGTAKEPDVTVKDGTTQIPSSEYTVSYENNIHAGSTATVNITDVAEGNYTVNGSARFTIDPAVITVTPDAGQKKTYGEADSTLTYTYSGVIGEEQAKFTGKLTRAAGEDVGSYVIGLGTLALADNEMVQFRAADYTLVLSTSAVDYTIEEKAVTITGLGAEDKTYDGSDAATVTGTASITGLKAGDTVTVVDGTAKFADKNAGTDKTVTFTGYELAGEQAHNYKLAGQPAAVTADITPAVLKVADIGVEDKTYDGTATARVVSVTFDGLVAGEKLEKGTDYTVDGTYKSENAGTGKTVQAKVRLTDAVTNYVLSENGATYEKDGYTIYQASVLDPATATFTIRNGVTRSYTFTLPELPALEAPRNYGGHQYSEPQLSFSNTAYTGTATVSDDGKLSLQITGTGSTVGKVGEVTVAVTTYNYTTIRLTADLQAANQIVPQQEGELTLSPAEITYGEALKTINISGKMVYDGNEVPGTFTWQEPDAVLPAGTYSDVEWKFIPENTQEYAEVTGMATVKVNKAAQSGKATMSDYIYNETPGTPGILDQVGDGAVTYYYSTVNLNQNGTEWKDIQPTTLDAGIYYLYAEIAETENYTAFVTPTVPFEVEMGMPENIKIPEGLTAKYGQKLNELTLTNPSENMPGEWSWQAPSTLLDRIGIWPCYADFTPENKNYMKVVHVEVDVTVEPADGRNLATINRKQKYTDTATYTYQPDWSALPKGQNWNYGCEFSTSSGSTATLDKWSVDAVSGKLSYAITGGQAGDVVTFLMKAQCYNYTDFTVTLNVTLTEKDEQAALTITGGTTVVYGQILKLGTKGGSGTGAVTYSVTNGTGEATIDNNGRLTPVKVGTVKVQATKAGDENYSDMTSDEVEITITKAKPTGKPKYTKITKKYKTLADAALELLNSTIKLPGQILWVAEDGVTPLDDSTIVKANKSYKWLFIPADSVNYTNLTGSVVLYRMSSDDDDDSNGAGEGGTSYTAASSCTIEATAGVNGSISPAGATTIRAGGDQTYTITPDKGYAVAKVLVDGSSVGAVTTYTFQNVTRNHTIQVVFMKANGNPQTGVCVDMPEEGILE